MTYCGEIKYIKNANHKLNCPYHTTIRLNIKRYNVGMLYSVMNNGEFCYYAEIVHIDQYKLHTVPASVWFTDTGLDKYEAIELLKSIYEHQNINWETQPVYVLTVKMIGTKV